MPSKAVIDGEIRVEVKITEVFEFGGHVHPVDSSEEITVCK